MSERHALTFWIEHGKIHVSAACHRQQCDLARSIELNGCDDFIAMLINGPGGDDMGMIEIGTLAVDVNDDWEVRFTARPHEDAKGIR